MKANTLVIYLLLFIFVGASVSQTPVGRYLYPMSVSSAQRDSLNLPGDGQVPMIYNSDTTRWEFTIDNGVNWRHIIDNSQSESSRTIAVFEIPIQFRIDGDGDGYRNGGYPVDFEFKIYKNSDYGDFDPSSELIDPAMWYSSRDSSNSSQVLPRGLPDGFYMGGPGSGVAGEQQKIVKVISHSEVSIRNGQNIWRRNEVDIYPTVSMGWIIAIIFSKRSINQKIKQ